MDTCTNIEKLVEIQREYFLDGRTLDVEMRIDFLKKLKGAIKRHEEDLANALYADLRKSNLESYMSETGMVLDEVGYVLKNIRKWTKTKGMKTPLAQFLAKSFVVPEPYGVVLIMAPWNYPVQLCLEPLIGAIAAGNTAIIKPSAYAPKVSSCIVNLVQEVFDPQYVAVVEGDENRTQSF